MKKFQELIEARGDTAVFTLGRFNPPTTGHEKLIKKLDSVAKKNSAPMYVFPTHSTDPAKNPLPHGLKVAYMKKMYRRYAKNIQISKARNVFEVAKVLYDKGHKAIIMVVGSDRVSEFSDLLDKYNGVDARHGYYGFDNIEVVSAGERDPDAEGVSGMSASKMRAAAADGDKDSFLKGIPSGFKDGEKLYRDVRKFMGIREERDMGDMTDFEQVRDSYLTGKIWNVGDSVIVEGVSGEVVRKGTNYLSYVTEDGKVHKAWLHQIQLNEAKSNMDKMRDALPKKGRDAWDASAKKNAEGKWVVLKKRGLKSTMQAKVGSIDYKKLKKQGWSEELDEVSWESPPTHNDPLITVKDSKGQDMMHANLSTAHSFWKLKEFSKNKDDLIKKIHKAGINGEIKVTVGKKGKTAGHSNHPNPMGSILTITLSKSHKKQVNERNYRKEYDNYQGTPEQIARRSSRNKARRIMGDKTKIGMDVGHKDNNPMNNDPSNLRNEVPSDNRREPRLREIAGRKLSATDQSELYRLTALAMKKPGGSPAQKAIIKKLNVLRKKQGLKPIGEAVELDELSSMLPWLDRAAAKVSQITHPKGWDRLVKQYVDGMKDKEHQAHPGAWASEVARQYRSVNGRDLVKYINKLVDKGKLPKELKAELEPQKEQWNFKDFVEKINRNAKNNKRN